MTLARTRTHESVCAHLNLNIMRLPSAVGSFESILSAERVRQPSNEWVRRTFRYIIMFFVCLFAGAGAVYLRQMCLCEKYFEINSFHSSHCVSLFEISFQAAPAPLDIKTIRRKTKERKRTQEVERSLMICAVCACASRVWEWWSGKTSFPFLSLPAAAAELLLHHRWHDECFLSF